MQLANLESNLEVLWASIVENYRSRDLKQPDDKLPAISGLAQRYAEMCDLSESEYHAGLWLKTLVRDLLWVQSLSKMIRVSSNKSRRPGRAPTWSWASVDGNICYENYQKLETTDSARIESCQVELTVDGDVLGQVRSGVLAITCAYMVALAGLPSKRTRKTPDQWYLHSCGRKQHGRRQQILGKSWPDDPSELEPCDGKIEVHCLGLRTCEKLQSIMGPYKNVRGIAVRFDVKAEACKRVGYFNTMHEDFESYGTRDFKIV